jgi:hypothetical protein
MMHPTYFIVHYIFQLIVVVEMHPWVFMFGNAFRECVMGNVKVRAKFPFVTGDTLTLCDASHMFRTASRFSPTMVVGVCS